MIWRRNWGFSNLREIEYSKIVRTKLMNLRIELTTEYGDIFSKKVIGKMTKAVRSLEIYCDMGIRISDEYEVETDYRYIFVNHNYFIYRYDDKRVIIVNMFNENEDFMMKLFGISGRTDESFDYWGE